MKSGKPDEMEMAVNFRAMRVSWVLGSLALLGWIIGAYAAGGGFPAIPFIILCGQTVVFYAAKLILTRRMTEGGDEE